MASRKINLIHTTLRLGVGGLERFIAELSLRLDRERFNVEVCCFSGLGMFADELKAKGIEITLLERRSNLGYIGQLKRFLKQKQADIVHAHTGAFFHSALAAKMAGVPAIIYTEHGRFEVDPIVRIVEDFISARITDRIIAVSEQLRRQLIDKVKFPPGKVTTLINGINTGLFKPREKPDKLLREFSLEPDRRIIGTVGRLWDVKDQTTMIKAFKIVHERMPATALLLVGDGPLRQELTDLAESLNLSDSIIFAGDRKDVPDMLGLFDLFVLSSVSEGTSLSLLEGMASGAVPVVTNVGGNPEIVEHEVSGLLAEPRDPQGLADAMYRALSDRELYEKMRENAIAKVRSDYSLDAMVEAYVALYLEILSNKKVPGLF